MLVVVEDWSFGGEALPPAGVDGKAAVVVSGAGSVTSVVPALAVASATFVWVVPAVLPATPIRIVTDPFSGSVCTDNDVAAACCCEPSSVGCGGTSGSSFSGSCSSGAAPAVSDCSETDPLSWLGVPSCEVSTAGPGTVSATVGCCSSTAAGPVASTAGVSGGDVTAP